MIGGVILDLIQFPPNAVPGEVVPEVIWRLGLMQGPATSVFTLLSLVFYFRYKLDRKRHAEIAAALAARREQPPDNEANVQQAAG